MDYNYHTHTKYCNHASGEMEDYVKYAVKHGIRYMGFSDHSPFVCPGYESHDRIRTDQLPEYFAEGNRLRKKYQHDLDLKIGFEMEYYPLYFCSMLKTVLDAGAEDLILGQHFVKNEYPDLIMSFYATDNEEYLLDYTDCVLKGIQSGVFTYVAHPDVFNYQGKNTALYDEEMERICLASKEYHIPLEINFGGARSKLYYPKDRFFQIAGSVGCPITMGMDAHCATDAYDEESIAFGKDMIKRHRLNYIGRPSLILLQEKKEELIQKFFPV